MLKTKKNAKKNPLTKAQNRLLRDSLKKLLGDGLLMREPEKEQHDGKAMVLRNALNIFDLNN